MIPTSLAGLVLFVVLMTPGLVLVLRRERTVPARQISAFRETVRVVAASTGCLLLAGLLLTLLRALLPQATVDIGALLRDPAGYTVDQHARLAWWSLAGLAIAVLVGFLAADPRAAATTRRFTVRPGLRWLLGTTDTDIRAVSSWSRVFGMFDDDPTGPGPVIVGALLTDGTYVRGTLSSHSPTVEETPDRDMVLTAPLQLRTTDGAAHDLGPGYTVISASRIVRLDVTHVAPQPPP